MNLQELKDRAKEFFQTKWQQFQETATYAQLKEKYDDMPARQQSLLKIGGVVLALILLFLPPVTWYRSSADNLASFEDDRGLLKQVLQVGRRMQETPDTIPQLSTADIKARLNSVIGTMQLLPDQVKGINEGPFPSRPGSHLIPAQLTAQGVEITIDKLNLRQIIDLSFRIQNLKSEGIRTFSMDIARSAGETHYYILRAQVGNVLSTTPIKADDTSAKGDKK